jgi:hypothetical protein
MPRKVSRWSTAEKVAWNVRSELKAQGLFDSLSVSNEPFRCRVSGERRKLVVEEGLAWLPKLEAD